MGSWMKIVVLLYLTSAVLCTPFINQLQPGQEWPTRGSVKQPNPDDSQDLKNEVTKTTEDANEVDKAVPEDVPDIKDKDVPDIKDKDVPDIKDKDVPDIKDKDVPDIKDKDVPDINDSTPKDSEKVDYTGCQVWKVSTSKTSFKRVINKLASEKLIASWGGNISSIDVLVKPKVIDNVTSVLKSKRIPYSIMIEDLQQRINEENPPLDENESELQDRRGHRMTWKQYHRVDDIHGFMDFLAKTYPSIVSVNSIGKSYEGRDLKVLRISDGKPTNKAVFVDGGIHAREWISPAVVTYFINQFAENFDIESDDIKNIDWYFLPVLNPDGYEYTRESDRLWRKNRRGVAGCTGADLNRNFGFHWGGKGASRNPCSEIYRGSAAFSEPESKAVAEFFGSTATKFSAYLTYHSYGQYLLYPWGYDNTVPPDYKQLQAVGEQIAESIQKSGGSRYRVGSSSGLLYPASGGSDDWAKSLGIKYTYTIELSDTGRYGFVLPASLIEPVARENLAGLRVLAHQVNKS